MASQKQPSRLGKGIGSLLSNRQGINLQSSEGKIWVNIDALSPSPEQPRENMRGIEGLSESLRRHGMMQPILATLKEDGQYEILAGERRWRAAQMAEMKKVPVLIREGALSGEEKLELGLIENIQREDLDAIERARACQRLMVEYKLTQAEVASRLGYKRPTISNLVRLLELPEQLQRDVSRGTLSPGHARAILQIDDNALRAEAAEEIVSQGLSVRAAEEFCKTFKGGGEPKAFRARPKKPAWAVEMQESLSRSLGSRVEIRLRAKSGGKIIVHFADLEELDTISKGFGLRTEAEELLGS